MTTRAPIFSPRILTSRLTATLGYSYNGTIQLPTGAVQTPLAHPLTDPVRFIANPWAAINSQWYLETSSQELYLKSNPEFQTSADLPKIAGRLIPSQASSPLVLLTTVAATPIPPGQRLNDLKFVLNPGTALPSQLGSPFALLQPSGVVALPPGHQLFDLRIQPNPWVAINSQNNNNPFNPLNPPPVSIPGSEYIYYTHHKGIR